MRRWFQKLPPPVKLGLQALLLAIVLSLPIFFLVYPKFWQIQALRPQVESLEGKITAAIQKVKGFTSPSEAERGEWVASRTSLLAKLPPDEALPNLVEELTLLAARSKVVDLLITTSSKVKLEPGKGPFLVGEESLAKAQPDLQIDLGYFPIQMSFRSSYRELARFVEGVQNLPPLVTIASLEVRRGVPLLGVQMTLRAYQSGRERHGPR